MEGFKIRDRRDRGWFYLDNEYLNGYAKIFGPVGTAIYVSLCRHADERTQECFPSMQLIAEEVNVHRETVSKYIKWFEKCRLLRVERSRDESTKKWKNNTYFLLDKSEWMSHAEITDMDSHVEMDGKSHVEPFDNKETHLNKTHKDTVEETTVISRESEEEEIVPTNDDGEEVKPKWGIKKKPKYTSDKPALEVIRTFSNLCSKHIGKRPIENRAAFFRANAALKILPRQKIEDLFEDWFLSGKPDEDLIHITRALSDNQLNSYVARQ